MEIINSTLSDIDKIFSLYDEGTAYQKSLFIRYWQGFDRELIIQEINEKRQWKLLIDGEIACIFCTTFSDPLIWEEKDKDPAVYLHRIVTHPDFRKMGLVKQIVSWTKQYARENGKRFIRMDTGSGNDKLNNHYISCGFSYLGVTALKETAGLPAHYQVGTSSLFELDINS